MCRNIRPLFNFEPPATDDEVRAATRELVDTLETTAPPKSRDEERRKAKARAAKRYGTAP